MPEYEVTIIAEMTKKVTSINKEQAIVDACSENDLHEYITYQCAEESETDK